MSQRAVEITLGRLITDGAFRRTFYTDPAATCRRESLDLTTQELDALMALDRWRLQAFAKSLDARIVRAAVGCVHYWSTWASGAQGVRERNKLSRGKSGLARGAK